MRIRNYPLSWTFFFPLTSTCACLPRTMHNWVGRVSPSSALLFPPTLTSPTSSPFGHSPDWSRRLNTIRFVQMHGVKCLMKIEWNILHGILSTPRLESAAATHTRRTTAQSRGFQSTLGFFSPHWRKRVPWVLGMLTGSTTYNSRRLSELLSMHFGIYASVRRGLAIIFAGTESGPRRDLTSDKSRRHCASITRFPNLE